MFLRCVSRLGRFGIYQYSTKTSPWLAELEQLRVHSTLLHQTTLSDMVELRDIKPMMSIFEFLKQRKGVDKTVLRNVTRALNRTVRDSSSTMSQLLRDDKQHLKVSLFRSIEGYCDQVGEFCLKNTRVDIATCGTLMSTYETVNPEAGVAFFQQLGRPELAGSAIQCMVKAKKPLQDIEQVFIDCPPPANDRRTATMVWAFLRYGQDAKAEALASTIPDNCSDGTLGFLQDAFVGDASPEIARKYIEMPKLSRAPHPSSMTRFLQRVWDADHDIDDHLRLFAQYLDLVHRTISEINYLSVTRTVVDNVVSGCPSPDDAKPAIEQLAEIYSGHAPSKKFSVFLNVLLSAVTERWPNSSVSGLVQMLLNAYRSEDLLSPTVVRIQLNSLENTELPEKSRIIRDLWALTSHQPQLYDWMALLRATKGSQYFYSQWTEQGRPFESDLRRFGRSRHIEIQSS